MLVFGASCAKGENGMKGKGVGGDANQNVVNVGTR